MQGLRRVDTMPHQPAEKRLEASLCIAEGGLTNPFSSQESSVELGLGDVDANDVHEPLGPLLEASFRLSL
jgi:hypothetical protein